MTTKERKGPWDDTRFAPLFRREDPPAADEAAGRAAKPPPDASRPTHRRSDARNARGND